SGELNEDFKFLKTLSLDYPPRSLPSLNEIGKVCPISRADLLGLDRNHGVHKVWRCLAPYYAVQIAPELGIEWRAQGVTFSETHLRVYIHPLGLVFALRSLFQTTPEEGGLSGFKLASILNNLERNRGVRLTAGSFKKPRQTKCVVDLFYQLYQRLA